MWFVYRTNPAISFWDTPGRGGKIARFPFIVAFAYTRDEQPFRRRAAARRHRPGRPAAAAPAATKYQEQFWEHEGFALRQPGGTAGEARDFTDICTELARRCGIPEKYNAAINRGKAVASSSIGPYGDFSLDPKVAARPRRHLGRCLQGRQRRATEGR